MRLIENHPLEIEWFENGEDCQCLLLTHHDPEYCSEIMPVVCQQLAATLRRLLPKSTDIIPGRDSLTVVIRESDEITSPNELIEHQLKTQLCQAPTISKTVHDIPVCYDERLGTDITELSHRLGLSAEEIINRHLQSTYRLDMLGFLPGFFYLSGLDQTLHLPRKDTPAISVPEGSIAIAESMSGIYSLASPGGWWIIGRTPKRLFDLSSDQPVTIAPLDNIRFRKIEYEDWRRLTDD